MEVTYIYGIRACMCAGPDSVTQNGSAPTHVQLVKLFCVLFLQLVNCFLYISQRIKPLLVWEEITYVCTYLYTYIHLCMCLNVLYMSETSAYLAIKMANRMLPPYETMVVSFSLYVSDVVVDLYTLTTYMYVHVLCVFMLPFIWLEE